MYCHLLTICDFSIANERGILSICNCIISPRVEYPLMMINNWSIDFMYNTVRSIDFL